MSLAERLSNALDQAYRLDGHPGGPEDWHRELGGATAEMVVGELEAAATPVLHLEIVKVSGKRWVALLHESGVDLLRLVASDDSDRENAHVRRRFIGRPPGLRYHEESIADYGGATIAVVAATRMDEPLRVRVRNSERPEALAAMTLLRRWAREPEH